MQQKGRFSYRISTPGSTNQKTGKINKLYPSLDICGYSFSNRKGKCKKLNPCKLRIVKYDLQVPVIMYAGKDFVHIKFHILKIK